MRLFERWNGFDGDEIGGGLPDDGESLGMKLHEFVVRDVVSTVELGSIVKGCSVRA